MAALRTSSSGVNSFQTPKMKEGGADHWPAPPSARDMAVPYFFFSTFSTVTATDSV